MEWSVKRRMKKKLMLLCGREKSRLEERMDLGFIYTELLTGQDDQVNVN